jgi:hypothetical protein
MRNVGPLDRTIRIGVGTAMVVMAVFGPLGWWGIFGLLPLLTGIAGVCPFYPLIGRNTAR